MNNHFKAAVALIFSIAAAACGSKDLEPAEKNAAPPETETIVSAESTCGARGQLCCAGGVCEEGLGCNSNNVCRPCGDAGRVCCANETCNSGLECNNNVCECGAHGQACCPDGSCAEGAFCNSNNICKNCGGDNERCCPGNTCDSGFACFNNRCLCTGGGCGCGLPGEACCSNGCIQGAICSGGTCFTNCGQLFQQCCPTTPSCFAGACNNGVCQP